MGHVEISALHLATTSELPSETVDDVLAMFSYIKVYPTSLGQTICCGFVGHEVKMIWGRSELAGGRIEEREDSTGPISVVYMLYVLVVGEDFLATHFVRERMHERKGRLE